MDIQLTTPIASGRTAEVYAWKDGTILKLYRDWCPPDWAEHEVRIASAVMRAGLPVPAVEEQIVEMEGRRGVVYERLDGASMLDAMKSQPWKLFQFADTLAGLQAEIHRLSLPELPRQRPGLEYAIQHAEHLPADLRPRVLAALEKLPDDTRPCHGDLHPLNILVTSHGPIVIDWMTAACGNPLADVARTSLILTIGVAAARDQVPFHIRMFSSWYHQRYLRRYLTLNPDPDGQLKLWKPIMAAARLNENIVPEREALIAWVREGLQ